VPPHPIQATWDVDLRGDDPLGWPGYRPPEEESVGIAYLAREYLRHPPPAQFHFIVSPLVMWIWIGGVISFGGGAIALWPSPRALRARVRARVRSRVAEGLAGA